jgi:hypothetical protein
MDIDTLPSDWPRYEDNRPVHIVQVDGETFVDWKRSHSHSCLYFEYGLVDHLRCRICGHLIRRDDYYVNHQLGRSSTTEPDESGVTAPKER